MSEEKNPTSDLFTMNLENPDKASSLDLEEFHFCGKPMTNPI
jgi:hypothetical protein